MVCSPHQYTLQKIAMPYMPIAAYLPQNNYQQKSAYQFMPQQQLYNAIQMNVRPLFTYQTQTQNQYASSYQIQNNELSRNTIQKVQFTPAVWTPVELEPLRTSATQPLASSWQDYGLPLYRAPGIVDTKDTKLTQKTQRDDLMQRIQLELAAMNEEKLSEDHLCAA